MRAVLSFSLPKEQADFEDACDGYKYHLAFEELDQQLRNYAKHGIFDDGRQLTPKEIAFAEHIREALHTLLGDRGLSLYP